MHDATDARDVAQRNEEIGTPNGEVRYTELSRECELERRALVARLRAEWVARLREGER